MIVRVVINGYSQGTMTWGELKILSVRYGARIIAENQKSTPPVFQLRGGSKQPSSG